jgi:hypothetical protein
MASQIDFVVAAGILIVFVASLVLLITNYVINYFSIGNVANLQTVAYDTFYAIFSGPGIPSNWENSSSIPVELGLTTNLYEVPFIVNETNGTTRTNYTLNVTFKIDPNCQNKSWNTTLRIYDSNGNSIPLNIYNTTFCVSQYVNKTDLVFNVSLQANSAQKFFLFYSAQQTILPNSSSYSYPTATNYTVFSYPEMTLQTVSVGKLLALRNLSYNQLSQIISPNYRYYIEVGK